MAVEMTKLQRGDGRLLAAWSTWTGGSPSIGFSTGSLSKIYDALLRNVLEGGEASPRGHSTREILGYTLQGRVPDHIEDAIFALGDAYGIVVDKIYHEETDEYMELERALIAKLTTFKEDESSRQCVIVDPTSCISTIQLLVRDGMLHVFATLRSSDVYNKLLSDLVFFTNTSLLLCGKLGKDVVRNGVYLRVHLNSAHMYKKDIAKVRKVAQHE